MQGNNRYGQLGTGDKIDRGEPAQVRGREQITPLRHRGRGGENRLPRPHSVFQGPVVPGDKAGDLGLSIVQVQPGSLHQLHNPYAFGLTLP